MLSFMRQTFNYELRNDFDWFLVLHDSSLNQRYKAWLHLCLFASRTSLERGWVSNLFAMEAFVGSSAGRPAENFIVHPTQRDPTKLHVSHQRSLFFPDALVAGNFIWLCCFRLLYSICCAAMAAFLGGFKVTTGEAKKCSATYPSSEVVSMSKDFHSSNKSNHKKSNKYWTATGKMIAPPPPNCQFARPLRSRNARWECRWCDALNCDHLKKGWQEGSGWRKEWMKKRTQNEVETLRDGVGKGEAEKYPQGLLFRPDDKGQG